ncbi:MAG: PAS domain S-box protein [Ignavibacteriaceae bacterium]
MRMNSRPTEIKKWHILALTIVISIIIILGAYTYFSYEKQAILTERHNELKAIVELKISQIVEWNKERLTAIRIFSQSPFFVDGLKNWLDPKSNLSARSEMLKRLALINADSLYSDVMVADTKGELLLSLDPKLLQIDSTIKEFVKKTVAEKKITSTDLYRCQPHNTIHLDYVAPVIDKNNVVIAALILRVNPDNYLYPLIDKWPTTSKTFETLIIRKDGDNVLYLNELSQRKNAALKFRTSLAQKEVPAVQAALGYKGIFEGINYHGVKVLAYISPVHGTPWIIIAQEDVSEIYSALYLREKVIISFTILLISVLSVGLIWYYHYRQRNIYRELLSKEKELREAHGEFDIILYSIGDGVITTDNAGFVKQLNSVAEQLTGWSEAEAKGKLLEDVFHIVNEETRNKVENPVKRVLSDGMIVGLANHTILISKDGREIPIADSGAPIRNPQDEIEGVVLVFRDKTEEHRAEKLIRQSEARLRRAELASKDGNWELHLDSKTMIASEGAAKIYGVAWKEMTFEDVKKMPLPEYRPVMDDALKNLIENNQPYNIEFKIRAADTGEIKDIHSIAEYDSEHKILFGVIQDITEYKKLEQSRFQLLNIIEKSLNEIYVFDAATLKFEYVNNSALENLGYSFQEICGLTPVDIKPEFTEETFRHAVEPLITGTDELFVFETIHRRKDGSDYPVEVHLQLHRLEDKNVFFAIINDITEHKRTEAALRDNEAFLNNLLATMPIPVFYKDKEGKYTDANNSFISLFGYSREQLIGKTVFDLYPPELAEIYFAKDKELFDSGGTQTYESKFVDTKGSEHDVLFYKSAYRNTQNEIAGLIVAILDITERKKAEDAIQESEERYRKFFENNDAIILFVDPNTGRIIFANNSAEKFYGWSKEELLQMNVNQINTKPPEEIKIQMAEARKRGQNYFVFKHRIANGGIRDVEVYQSKLKVKNDDFFSLIVHDITEREQARNALKESEERFRTVTQSANDAIITADSQGIIIDWNKGAEKIFGYSEAEIKGENLTTVIPEHYVKDHLGGIKRVEQGGEHHVIGKTVEVHGLHKNENEFPLELSLAQWETSQGKYFTAIIRDITERRQGEEELRKLSRAVEQSPAIVVITDPDGTIEYVNTKFCDITGFSQEAAIGKTPRILKSGHQDEKFYKELWDTILSGKEWKGEFLDKKKNGELYWESALISPLVNNEGIITNFVAVNEDITEKKKMFEELVIAKDKAEEMNRLKSNFLANMSHELRTPLNGILGYAEMLSTFLDNPEYAEMCRVIYSSGKRLSDTLNLILDLTKASSDKIEVISKNTSLVPAVENVINLYTDIAAGKNLLIEKVFSEENVYAKLDSNLFERTINNIMNNAVKFTCTGKITIEIGKETADEKDWAYVKVKDTGIGIAEDQIELIWDEFRQVSEGMSRSYEGAGLGLTISKRIIELMNGVITVESNFGVGSTFTVKFPAVEPTSVSQETNQVEEIEPKKLEAIKIHNTDLPLVLYVEDDFINQNVVKLYLNKLYRVETAKDGQSALQLVSVKQYDLILMDMNLGSGMDGVAITKEIRKMPQYAETPIVAVTAYAMESDKKEFLSGGCSHYLAKPFDKHDLLELLTSLFVGR